MAEIEQLSILIDVLDSFSEELDRLLFKLGQVETAAETVDPVNVDVDVDGQTELRGLLAELAALQAADAAGVGNVDVGVNRSGVGSAGAASAAGAGQFSRLEDILMAQGELLSDALEGFDGQVGDATRTVKHLSASADEASDGLLGMDLRMTDFHNALARLIPLLLVFIGALPALIGALAALAAAAAAAAAALAGITALGAIGFGLARGDGDVTEGLSEAMSEIEDDFMDAFRPLAERLAHVFEGALDGLDRLFQQIANRGDALMGFVDEAQDVGSFLVETIPPFLADVARFADAASNALGVLVNRVGNVDIFGVLAGVLAETLPPLIKLGDALVKLAPVIFNISVGFLRVVNAIVGLFTVLGDLLSILPLTQQQFGFIVATVLTLVTALALLNTAIVSNTISSLINLGKTLIGAIGSLSGYTSGTYLATQGTLVLANAIRTLGAIAAAAVVTGGIAVLASTVLGIGGIFGGTSSKIDKATESLKAFDRQSRRMNNGANPYRNPDVGVGDVPTGRGSSVVDITVEGDADEQTVREQTKNAMYRLDRTGRAR
jgi:hypothetical protein